MFLLGREIKNVDDFTLEMIESYNEALTEDGDEGVQIWKAPNGDELIYYKEAPYKQWRAAFVITSEGNLYQFGIVKPYKLNNVGDTLQDIHKESGVFPIAPVTDPVTDPEVVDPVTDPEVPVEPEIVDPEVTDPEVTDPEVPEVTDPVTDPEVPVEPEIVDPEVTDPEVVNPNIDLSINGLYVRTTTGNAAIRELMLSQDDLMVAIMKLEGKQYDTVEGHRVYKIIKQNVDVLTLEIYAHLITGELLAPRVADIGPGDDFVKFNKTLEESVKIFFFFFLDTPSE